MTDEEWFVFFRTCSRVLGAGTCWAYDSESWCSWTTFSRLGRDAGYWTSGIPKLDELLPTHVVDGGTWGQPFAYDELAHVIVPRVFTDDLMSSDGVLLLKKKEQSLEALSSQLKAGNIKHDISEHALEIKLF